MKKIVITTPSFGKYNPEVLKSLKNSGCVVKRIVPFNRKILTIEIVDADALVVGLEKIDAEVLNAAKKLTVIAKHGVGVDNIDLTTAKNLGIRVANSPGTNTQAVADLAWGLMLSLVRSIPIANSTTKNGEWLRYDGVSIWKKTLGVIGLGAIGTAVAKRAKGFEMTILGYDVTAPSQVEEDIGIIRVPLEKLLAESDIVTLHVPLIHETDKMIGAKELNLMKSSSFIINTSRGGIINEQALYEALTGQKIAGAGIDAFELEPPTDNPLLHLENVVVTPHMGAFTIESNQMTSELTAQNVLKAINGKEILNRII